MKFNLNALLVLLAFFLATINAAPTGVHRGDLTFYQPGLGACGRVNKSSDSIAAISHTLYDQFTKGGNPNNNSLCGKRIKITFGGKSATVTMVDRCEGCGPNDLDVTTTVFKKFASLNVGRLHNVKWSFV